MATLDFKELAGDPSGENFQALIRLVGERSKLIVQWTGRGPDGGRDLIFVENQQGPLKSTSVRWLVSCKDNSLNGRSVTERDVGSVVDKVRQHDCQGFLLATSTTASAGLKELLDKLDLSVGGPIQTKVWDRFELTKLLLRDEFADLFLQFLPKQKARESVQKLDAAREVIESAVPRFVSGYIRERLVSHYERASELAGSKVWPHDAELVSIIDNIAIKVVSRGGIPDAAEKIRDLHFDAFVAFIDRLIRNFPENAKQLLRVVGKNTSDGAVIFNVVEILRETDDFDLEQELEITRKCDPDTLFELYGEMTLDILQDVGTWDWRLPGDIERFADKIVVESAKIDDLEFCGGDAVNLSARLTLVVFGHSSNPEEPSRRDSFSYNIIGYWLPDGIEIESMK
jgi:Restriction endonuclease